ncbi:MAG: hypothetical protein ACYSUI_08750, partial [Planctomycetota bacterium]
MFSLIVATAIALPATLWGCRRDDGPAPATPKDEIGQAWFEEVADQVGLNFAHVPFLVQRHYI